MKEATKDIIAELKQKKHLDQIYAGKVREFDTYFTPTNKIEIRVKKYKYEGKNYSAFVDAPEEYVPLPTAKQLAVYNDMSVYKLKKDRIDRIINLKGVKKW